MDRCTYHYKISWWIVFFGIGIFTMSWSLYGIVEFFRMGISPKIFSNLVLLGSVLVFLAFFAFGLIIFSIPLTSRIVLSPFGIEFHTLGKLVKAPWKRVSIEIPENMMEKVHILNLKEPEVIISRWTHFVPWKVTKVPSDSIIRISQFGSLNPQKFIADIQRFAPYLGVR